MAKVLIDIPDEEYNLIKMKLESNIGGVSSEAERVIVKGILLPKGRGRLFILDEEKAKNYLTNFGFSCQKWISEVGISNATIKVIDADKEDNNNER